jgi:hypothetical protein
MKRCLPPNTLTSGFRDGVNANDYLHACVKEKEGGGLSRENEDYSKKTNSLSHEKKKQDREKIKF